MVIECPQCETMVEVKVISSHICTSEDGLQEKYNFIKCSKCGQVMLALQEDYGGGFDDDDPYRVYPIHEDRIGFNIPKKIRDAYGEAWQCQRAKAYTAAAIMCRKTLEGICAEEKVVENSLATSLKTLKDRGIIENRLFEWADALRISGNEAAHDVGVTVSREDSKDLLDFTKALLEYIFTFRDKFEKFKTRREKNKGDKA